MYSGNNYNVRPPFMSNTPAPTFGTASVSAPTFGQPTSTQAMFPSSNMFQSPSAPSFNPAASAVSQYGSPNIFGQPLQQQQQQQQQPPTNVIFGGTTAFGPTKSFNFGAPPNQSNLFGTSQAAQLPVGSNLFQSGTGSNLFGVGSSTAFNPQSQAPGTVVKFSPVMGTDTMQKAGVAQTISTKHYCITCMKEYEGKSLEELRFEDYTANRKGPQQQGTFNATTFGPTTTASVAPSIFGPPETKPTAFGQATPFGQASLYTTQSTPNFGLNSNQNSFLKPSFGNVATSTASSFPFSSTTATSNPFGGATQAAKPFTQPAFFGGNTLQQPQTGFGATPAFGQTSTQQPTTGFNFSQPAATQATSSLFPTSKPNTGFGAFVQPNPTPAFGQTAQTSFNSTNFGAKPVNSFGQSAQTGFGSSLAGLQQPQQPSMFGNSTAKPPMFGATNTGPQLFPNNSFQSSTPAFSAQLPPQPVSQFPLERPLSEEVRNLTLVATDTFLEDGLTCDLKPIFSDSSKSIPNPQNISVFLESNKRREDALPTRSKLKVQLPQPKRSPDYTQEGSELVEAKPASKFLINKKKPNEKPENVFDQYKRESPESDYSLDQEDEFEVSGKSEMRAVRLKLLLDHQRDLDTRVEKEIARLGESEKLNGSPSCRVNISPPKKSTTSSPGPKVESPVHEPSDSSEAIDPEPTAENRCDNSLGVVLTKPGYYMFPKLNDLDSYADENGNCVIEGLTIGRWNYGNIYFPDPINIVNMNFNEIVNFDVREVVVYPDEKKKPPVGQELNRPAQVTLDNIYPRKAGTNEYLTDVDELLKTNFLEKLIAITNKQRSRFIEYRPETGSWVFKVPHFSKYKYSDSDEEMCEVDENQTRATGAVSLSTVMVPPSHSLEESSHQMSILRGERRHEMIQPGDTSVPRRGLGGGAYHLPDGSEGSDPDFPLKVDTSAAGNDGLLELSSFSKELVRTSYLQKVKLAFHNVSLQPPYVGTAQRDHLKLPESATVTTSQSPRLRDSIAVRPRIYKLPKLPANMLPGRNILGQMRCYTDTALFKGDSFKCGWFSDCRFYSYKPTFNVELQYTLYDNHVDVHKRSYISRMMPDLGEVMNVVINRSVSHYRQEICKAPVRKLAKDSYLLESITAVFNNHVINENIRGKDRYLMSVFNLCTALWGKSEYKDRRQPLSDWLTLTTRDLTDDRPDYFRATTLSIEEQIFRLLSYHKVREAAELAMYNDLNVLSLIITQLGSGDNCKKMVKQFVDSLCWESSVVSDDMKKIYLLLSGTVLKNDINVFENLDWRRCLGLFVWYITTPSAELDGPWAAFNEVFEAGNCKQPTPPYSHFPTKERDLLYLIIGLYMNNQKKLTSILDPITHTWNRVDYRLTWLLMQVFVSLEVGVISENEMDHIHNSYASQLQEMGEWQWSMVVLQYLSDNIVKKNQIMRILERHLSAFQDTHEVERELVHKFGIPAEWIHSVKAYKCELANDPYAAFVHHTYASQFVEGHTVFVDKMMAELFTNDHGHDNFEDLSGFLDTLSPHATTIPNWNVQGGLVNDYLKLQTLFKREHQHNPRYLNSLLVDVVERIRSFPADTDHQKLLTWELSRRCTFMYKILNRRLEPHFLYKHNVFGLFDYLVMPPDHQFHEYTLLMENKMFG